MFPFQERMQKIYKKYADDDCANICCENVKRFIVKYIKTEAMIPDDPEPQG